MEIAHLTFGCQSYEIINLLGLRGQAVKNCEYEKIK